MDRNPWLIILLHTVELLTLLMEGHYHFVTIKTQLATIKVNCIGLELC